MGEAQKLGWEEVVQAVTNQWSRTQDIAERLDLKHRPGSADLVELRDWLYALELRGFVDHEPIHNGHRWRRSEAAEREDEPPRGAVV